MNIFKKKKGKETEVMDSYQNFERNMTGPNQTPRSQGTLSQKDMRSNDDGLAEEGLPSKKGQLLGDLHEEEFDFDSRPKAKTKPGLVLGNDAGSDKKQTSEQQAGQREPPKSVPKDMAFKSNPFSFGGPEVDLLGRDSSPAHKAAKPASSEPLLDLLGSTATVQKSVAVEATVTTNPQPSQTQKPAVQAEVPQKPAGPQVSLQKVDYCSLSRL